MSQVVDYFFAPFITPHERRRRAFVNDGGLEHSNRISPRDPMPGEEVAVHCHTRLADGIDAVAVYFTNDDSDPMGAYGIASNGSVCSARVVGEDIDPESGIDLQCWEAKIPAQADNSWVQYRIDAWKTSDPAVHLLADSVDPLGHSPEHGQLFSYRVDTADYPHEALDLIIYHIFVDRFASAHTEPALRSTGSLLDFFGGTLNGIIENLDYIANLGINCIWLSPVNESPTYHGYNPSSYSLISARYGGNTALLRLIAEAHRRGIKIMMDFVANHTSNEHPIFQEAMRDPSAAARQWYSFGDEWPPNGYLSFFNVANMPQLRTDLPLVRRYLFDAVRGWIRDWGVDAVRLDYVAGPTEDFWLHFQSEVKSVNPNALTLGEITGDFAEIDRFEGRLDGYMDFPLTKMFRQVFAQEHLTVKDLVRYLIQRHNALPTHMFGATSLDNHDMHRFLYLAMNDRSRLALAAFCQMTLPGAPIIYYGTEVGLSQVDGPSGQDVYSRMPMLWGDEQDSELRTLYTNLIHLRKQHASLRRGTLSALEIAFTDDDIGGYQREFQQERALVILNASSTSRYVPEIFHAIRDISRMQIYSMANGVISHGTEVSFSSSIPARGGIVIIETMNAAH